jgi:ribosome biogenesis GTPase
LNTIHTKLPDQGIVTKKSTGNYLVHAGGQVFQCSLSSMLRKELIFSTANPKSVPHRVQKVRAIEHTDPVAVGDVVRFINANDGTGMIVEVLPRRNKLARRTPVPMPGAHPFEQVIAANVDQMVPVFAAANPPPKWNLLDRYLASAESLGLPGLICITKVDLVQPGDNPAFQELREAAAEYRKIGYPLLLTSAASGSGLDELRQALQGRVSVLVGKSGVGKTSLLNALQPGLGRRVNEVNAFTGKGRHTTTLLEMIPLDGGGAIVDTPGMREFGLWDVAEDDLALLFPEMRPFVGHCRFGLGCRHTEEPGCALRKAVMAGNISPRRYQSFLRLKADLGEQP